MNKKQLIKSNKSKKSRVIEVVKCSKYEANQAVQANKKYWKDVFHKLDASNEETVENFTQKNCLDQILPEDLCGTVCEILDLPLHKSTIKEENENETEPKLPRRMVKHPHLSFRTRLNIDREMDSDTDVECSPRDRIEPEINIHRELLSRPEREQVTWPSRYLEPERDDEKTLERRADDLTDKIAREFCSYMQDLGGKQKSQLFTPDAIKDLFQVEFDKEIAKGIKIVMKELPTVPEHIAIATGNFERSQYAALEREIARDIRKERRPDKITAFGRSLPLKDQYITPKNNTAELWKAAKHVPRDLVTLKTVWEGITNIKSVKEYCRWMIEHPEHPRAPYLNSLGMFDEAVLKFRPTITEDNIVQASSSPLFVDMHEKSDEIEKDLKKISQEIAENIVKPPILDTCLD